MNLIGPGVLMLCISCSAAQDSGTSAIQVDSAGVQIMHSDRPAWPNGAGWYVVDEPVLRIGAVDQPADQVLHGVGPALRLEDGRLAIVNAGTELRIFLPDGRLQRTVGRAGRGPGEFVRITELHRLGVDSLLVFDAALLRYTVIPPDGEATHTFQVPLPGLGSLASLGPLASGGVLGVLEPRTRPASSGRIRPDNVVVRFALDPPGVDTLVVFPGKEEYPMVVGTFRGMFAAPFAWRSIAARRGEDVLIALTERMAVHVHRDGELLARFSRELEPRPVTQHERDEFISARRGAPLSDERARPAWNAFLSDLVLPPTHPVLDAMLVDGLNHTWLRHVERPVAGERVWSVFDPAGRWLGTVNTPEDLAIREIGSDYVLGVTAGAMNVNVVVLHRLVKP